MDLTPLSKRKLDNGESRRSRAVSWGFRESPAAVQPWRGTLPSLPTGTTGPQTRSLSLVRNQMMAHQGNNDSRAAPCLLPTFHGLLLFLLSGCFVLGPYSFPPGEWIDCYHPPQFLPLACTGTFWNSSSPVRKSGDHGIQWVNVLCDILQNSLASFS